MTTSAYPGIKDLAPGTCQSLASVLDAALIPVEVAAAALGMTPKRLLGFIARNSLRDPIGDHERVYGWSCRALADESSGVA